MHPLIEAMQQAVVATDLSGRVTYWNASAERLYGWSAADVMGRDVVQVLKSRSFAPTGEQISAAVRSGKSWSGEYTVQRRDGSELATFVTVSPVYDEQCLLVGVVSVTEDATERHRTREDRERLAAIVTSSDDAILTWDTDGIITSWNAGAERVFGYPSAEMLGRSRADIVPPDRRDEARQILERVRRGLPTEHLETQRIRKDGSVIDVSISASPLRDIHGQVTSGAVIARDISATKAYEQELRDAEQRLRSLFTNHPDAVFALDCQGLYTELNPACERLSGVPPEELVGTPIGGRTVERERVADGVRTALAGRSLTFEASLINRAKRILPVQVTLVPILINGSAVGVYGITKDISERKRIEHRLAMQARAQTTIADLGLLALTDIGTNELLRMTVEVVAVTLDVSNVVLLGYAPDTETFWVRDGVGIPNQLRDTSLASTALRTLIQHAETRRLHAREFEALFGVAGVDFGKRPAGLASRIPGRDVHQGLIVAWSRRARIYSEDDLRFLQQVTIVLGAAIDHYFAVEELRRRESEFKVLVEHTSDIIARFDASVRFMYVNPALQRMLGVPASNLLNRTVGQADGILPHDSDSWERAVRRVFRTGEDEELEILYADRYYQARFSPEFGPDQEVKSVLAVARDITADKRREAERSKLYQELLERDDRLHELMERMLLDQRQPRRSRMQTSPVAEQFTPRDRQILRLLARGMTNRQIALELGLRPSTVKNYVANILPRLNASDRTNAAVVAAQWGLLGGDAD